MKTNGIIRALLCVFILTFALDSFAKHKYALLVGISKYSPNYSWPKTNGTNDVDLIKTSLRGFSIKELRNSDATYSNICKELEKIILKSKRGDVIYIHLSGHGQPVEDMNGDEQDGWDESFIPYDAGFKYNEKGYKGECHLVDDCFNTYINKIRKAVGKSGFVYIVIDACHSGTMDRGDDENPDVFNAAPIRGTNTGFSKTKFYRPKREQKSVTHYSITASNNLADIIILEACAANQKNQEVNVDGKYYGPLSYSLFRTIKNYGIQKTLNWCDQIQNNMKAITKKNMTNQTMIIETSLSK